MKGAWEETRDPLSALRAGDPEPFEAFVRRHTRTLVAFFRRQGLSLEGAEDRAQDVMLRLYRHASSYRPRERFKAYCFRIATNVLIDHRRRKSVDRSQAFPGGYAESGAGPDPGVAVEVAESRGGLEPAELVSRDEEARRALLALSGLDESHRLVFELAVLEGLAYPEVASILAIPVGTVKSRMFHAVRKLRTALGVEEVG